MEYKKSFLKWAGGKYKLLDHILIANKTNFIDAFTGSAVVALNSQSSNIIANDSNIHLINCYETIKQSDISTFIKDTKELFKFNSEVEFYNNRTKFNNSTDTYEQSCLFIYLNRHAFNGLCRFNKSKKFNTPYGKYKSVYFPENEIVYFHEKSQTITFLNKTYDELFKYLNDNNLNIEDSFLYSDPPYASNNTIAFTSYDGTPFTNEDQKKLSEHIRSFQGTTLSSNNDVEFIREIYKGMSFKEILVNRNISCKSEGRVKEKEVLIGG